MLILDIIGALLSLLAVTLFTQARLIAWPVSLAACAINAVLYASTGIYGHMSLEFIYIIVNSFGWFYWWRAGEQAQHKIISFMPTREWLYHLLIAIVLIPLLAHLLSTYYSSDIPMLDALTTVMNMSALAMQCRGRVESWIGWFVADSVYIIIYLYKGLPFHTVQMLIYLLLAVRGYQQWQRLANQQLEIPLSAVMLD